ncbi:MAG: UDP-N-acetylmuramoyl-L-alanine--D-glutamate ligase [Rickettsiales bacterium]|jgi:UDP-N-acetylmuramoylalanine--D-glutamate ligase|nr:UDP-N-acetylmuramoyl-L-alanine--D-glutamate ligase [Rickettsiales bacterium]
MKVVDVLKKKVLLWGYGLEGKSALELLLRGGNPNDLIVAASPMPNEKIDGVKFISEEQILEQDFEVLLKSPGVSSYREEMAIIRGRGVLVTSILNILLAEVGAKKNLKTIGITGTKGKSTATSMCYSMLKYLGFRVLMLGNMGISFLDALECLDTCDYIVLELSSCQLENICYRMDYGVLLNLFPEHIDWHRSHENYFRDKLKILEYSEKCFVNRQDPITLSYIDVNEHKYFFNDPHVFHLENNFLCYAKDRLIDINSLGNVRGAHLFKNLCAILAVLREEKLDTASALEGLVEFKTLPHRLEIFHENNKLRTKFVDDSISTIPEATLEALKTFGGDNIFLIVGGFDRQQDCSKIVDFINKTGNIRKIFLIGQTGKKMMNILAGAEYSSSLEELLESLGTQDLEDATVLFSPGAASFDMFKNFEERGNKFKELVLKNFP